MSLAEEYRELMGEDPADTTEDAENGSDQPEDAEEEREQETDGAEEASGDTANTGSEGTDPAENEADKPTLSQRQFDKAFANRRDALKKQLMREHDGDIRLAARLRQRFAGLTDEEIAAKLEESEADELSEKTGWSKDESMQRVKARRAYEAREEEPDLEQKHADPYLAQLQEQRERILSRTGVDVLEALRDDEYLREQVNQKKMDLRDVYEYMLENRAAAPKPKKPPVVTRRASAEIVPEGMTDAQFEEWDRRLKRGEYVSI